MEPNNESSAKPKLGKLWLNVNDVAEQMGVHPDTVRRWEREGVIPPAMRRRERRVYSQEDLDAIKESVFSRKPKEESNQQSETEPKTEPKPD